VGRKFKFDDFGFCTLRLNRFGWIWGYGLRPQILLLNVPLDNKIVQLVKSAKTGFTLRFESPAVLALISIGFAEISKSINGR